MKFSQLPHRDNQDPDIQGDAHGSMGPSNSVDICAFALMHTIPFLPEIINWPALEDGCDHKGKTPKADADECRPEDTLNLLGWEDAHVEADNRQLYKRGLREVQPCHYVEVPDDIRDHGRRECPNILAEAVGSSTVGGNGIAGNGGNERGENEPVVESEVNVSDKNLVTKAQDDKNGRDDEHGIGRNDELMSTVPDGSTTGGQGSISSD